MKRKRKNPDPERLAYERFIRRQPCDLPNVDYNGMEQGDVNRPLAVNCWYQLDARIGFCSDSCHVKHAGMGGKSVPVIGNRVPLCHGHHMEMHTLGAKSFAAKYGYDFQARAQYFADRYTETLTESAKTP